MRSILKSCGALAPACAHALVRTFSHALPLALPLALVLTLVLTLTLALCACGSAHAGYDAAKARRIVTELGAKTAASPDVPGMSIAVLQKGGDDPVAVAFGTACIENATPMNTQSRFKIGSVTKVFTGALIHRFIEDGKLAYDTPIDRFFPGFPDGGTITVRHLLEHTSGIVDMLGLAEVRANPVRNWPPAELVALVEKQPLAFRPGARQAYSNTGFLMLAVICERISGRTYDDLVGEMFTRGLGMASLVPGNDTAIVPHLSCGYASGGESGALQLPMMASLAVAKGTGNLEATPSDVVRLVNLDRVLQDDVLDTVPLAPLKLPDGQVALVASKTGRYSLGELDGCTLFLFDTPKIALVGKLGSFPGFGTVYFYDRQTKIAVAISVNNERAISRAITLGADILSALRN